MSLTACRRQGIASLHSLSRHYSSGQGEQLASSSAKSSSSAQSHTTLPPAKMRALIALYHQADSWITPENLLERIDKAFVPELTSASKAVLDPDVIHSRGSSWTRMDDLDKTRMNMRMAPKMAQWDRSKGVDMSVGQDWSRQSSKRELKVIEALYGVDAPAGERLLPGLEVLQEASDMLDREEGGWKDEADVQDLLQQPKGQNP